MMSDAQLTTSRILLVDDNPTNLKVLAEAIRGQGWMTLVAADGESAIEQADYAHPDLILLDVMMPGMNGFETCQHLQARASTQAIPVIFMTALSDAVDKVKGLELGAVDYITKPFQQEEVIARIKLHLKLSKLAQALEQKNESLQQKIVQQAETEAQLQQLAQELERRVDERTAALTDSMQKLGQTQLQLIQSEKMSTLGELISGIGHEINNPINFISGNLLHVTDYTRDLLNLLNLYQAKLQNPDPELIDLTQEIDLDYLIEDVPNLLVSMQEGINRLRDISLSLRTFARSDISAKTEFQIHEGIESTLMLLKHRTKACDRHPEIQVIKRFGDLPPIRCYPGQLNQVFMNIIANAIDAIEDTIHGLSYQEIGASTNILITTTVSASKDQITIQIKDSGAGMPPEIQSHIFEPSFTTKPVGKGTGLGLPISRQIIVEKHGGMIDCVSELGTGTEFFITLPI